MPKTTMDEDRGAPPRQHDIGRAGKISSMQPKPEAKCVQHSSDLDFRTGVLRSDRLHDPPALIGCACIGHGL